MASVSRKIFIIRPWHSQPASLYPYVMDGVEYIDQAIDVIKKAGETLNFEVRIDKDVFIPGKTIRENLVSEISNASVMFNGERRNSPCQELLCNAFKCANCRWTGSENTKPKIVSLNSVF